MSKVDILSTIIQFPGHIFAKIIIYSACIAKSHCGEDKFIFDLLEKLKTFFKKSALGLQYFKHGLYDIRT